MSIELILARFGEDCDEAEQTNGVQHLAESARNTLRRLNRLDIDLSVSGDTLLAELLGGTAEIHADHAIFPIEQLDPVTMNVVFDLARAGDFVVLRVANTRQYSLTLPSEASCQKTLGKARTFHQYAVLRTNLRSFSRAGLVPIRNSDLVLSSGSAILKSVAMVP